MANPFYATGAPKSDCPLPNPTPATPDFPASGPPPVPGDSVLANQRYTDSRYGSFGSTHFMKPGFQEKELKAPPVGPVDPTGMFQNYDSQRLRGGLQGEPPPGAPGNIFAALNVNGAYKDDMWSFGQQLEDFAQRTVHMIGGSFYSISAVESGPGQSRAPVGSPYANGYDKKYTIGSINQAIATRGMSSVDDVAIIGAVNMGSSSFSNSLEDLDPDTGLTKDQRRRIHYGSVEGSENDAWIGRSIAPKPSTDKDLPGAEEADKYGVEIGYHEDDFWDPLAADLYRLSGSGHFIWFDNKKTDVDSALATTPPLNSGYVDSAIAVNTGVFSFVEGSWINVGEARGVSTILGGYEGAFPVSEGWFEPDERCGSTIRNWAGIEVLPPYVDPEIQVQAWAGVIVADQNPDGSGGSPQLDPSLFALAEGKDASSAPFSPENGAAAILRGHVVVGDGEAGPGQGWNVDALHVNGGIRLQGFAEPPALEDIAPHSEAAGFLYFDLARNCVRVAVPMVMDAGTSKQKEMLVWRDLDFAPFEKAHAARHAVRAPKSMSKKALEAMDDKALQDAHEGAKRAAAAGTSPYIPPRMQPLMFGEGAKRGEPSPALLFNQVPREHFDAKEFRLAWRRVSGAGQGGRHRRGGINWTPLKPGEYKVEFIDMARKGDASPKLVAQVSLEGVDFWKDAPDGQPGERGMVIQVMAVTAMGASCGTSFRLE